MITTTSSNNKSSNYHMNRPLKMETAEASSSSPNATAAPSQRHRSQRQRRGRARHFLGRQVGLLALAMLVLGSACAASFVWLGVRSVARDRELRLETRTTEIVQSVQTTWHEYETVALWIHQSLRYKTDYTSFAAERRQFEMLYEYVRSNGVQVQSISYLPNITHELRDDLQTESAQYYQQVYPEYNYTGFKGLQADPSAPQGFSIQPRSNQSFYFPQLLLQPIGPANEPYIDFDMLSSTYFSAFVYRSFAENQPLVSNPFPPLDGDTSWGNHIFLVHPGVDISNTATAHNANPTTSNRAMAVVLWSFGAFMERVVRQRGRSQNTEFIYIYDMTADASIPPLVGGVQRRPATTTTTTPHDDDDDDDPSSSSSSSATATIELVKEPITWDALRRQTPADRLLHRDIRVAQQTWKIVVVARPDDLAGQTIVYPVVGGVIMFLACLVVVAWYLSNTYRGHKMQRLQEATEAEKAALTVHHARASADAERQRNEYLAHEVRNPLASALAACSFVGSALSSSSSQRDDPESSSSQQPRQQRRRNVTPDDVVQDVNVIQSSLTYINDLLRSMLDVNKLACHQLVLDVGPTDVYRDVLEPVQAILSRRENPFVIELDMPQQTMDLVIRADRMRLKQVVLNLASNATKFVQQGFIRLSVGVTASEGIVIAVEDSGPGIPLEKRASLFSRFQLSLDVLNQGTGMGLHLCRGLVELMGGTISLDTAYDSGVEGCPGARFVVELPAVVMKQTTSTYCQEDPETALPPQQQVESKERARELPANVSILLVDDDTILRKLLSRSLKRIAPTWTVREAANGETALALVQETDFDLIFMDHYMASVERQMLGTEAIQAMRSQGVKSRICGLSANELRDPFLESGADHFMLKPFSTELDALKEDLIRALGVE